MKVISIIQPWATLIALGEKKFETRSWATKHRGELLIHASKKVDKNAWMNETIYMTLRECGILTVNDLPTGAIIASTILDDCFEIGETSENSAMLESGNVITGNEFAFGYYARGRFAWKLRNTRQLTKPIPAQGQLSLWNYPQKDADK